MSLEGNTSNSGELKGGISQCSQLNGSFAFPFVIHGKSAYEIAVINGFEGTEAEWLASLHGKDGKDGIDRIIDIRIEEIR